MTRAALNLNCAGFTTAAAAIFALLAPAAGTADERQLALVVDEYGHLSGQELDVSETNLSATPLASFSSLGGQPVLDKIAEALLKFVARSHELICDFPVSPSTVSFTFEVVQVQWSKKVLCQPQARQILQEALDSNADDSGTPAISFNIPKNLVDLSKFKDQFDRQKQAEAFQTFSSELVAFFCRMPVRPDELSLKIIPAKVEWDISSACKGQF